MDLVSNSSSLFEIKKLLNKELEEEQTFLTEGYEICLERCKK